MPATTTTRAILEAEIQREFERLQRARSMGNALLVDLIESTINCLLERLSQL